MNGSDMVAILWKQVTGLARQLAAKGLTALAKLLARVPRAQLVLWGASVLLLSVWWFEHQAHLRQTIELEQLQKQTTSAVSTLKAQAAAAIREANEHNMQAIHELESKRSKLEREASDLAARLQSLQDRERSKTAQVAALPPAELARRVADELGSRESGVGSQESGLSNVEPSASGLSSSAPTPNSQLPTPALALSSPQLHNLAAALVERDACREQKQAVGEQFANCRAQVGTNAAIIQQQVDSLAKLNQALSAKDEILARREIQQKAELMAARGSRLSRLARVVQWVAIGIVMGVVVR